MADAQPVDAAEWRKKAKARRWNPDREDGYLGAISAHHEGLPTEAEPVEPLSGHHEARETIRIRAEETVRWALGEGEKGFTRHNANARIGMMRAAIDPHGLRFGLLTNAELIGSIWEIATEYVRDSVERVYKNTENWGEAKEQSALFVPKQGRKYTAEEWRTPELGPKNGNAGSADDLDPPAAGSTSPEPAA